MSNFTLQFLIIRSELVQQSMITTIFLLTTKSFCLESFILLLTSPSKQLFSILHWSNPRSVKKRVVFELNRVSCFQFLLTIGIIIIICTVCEKRIPSFSFKLIIILNNKGFWRSVRGIFIVIIIVNFVN